MELVNDKKFELTCVRGGVKAQYTIRKDMLELYIIDGGTVIECKNDVYCELLNRNPIGGHKMLLRCFKRELVEERRNEVRLVYLDLIDDLMSMTERI